ncbi:hypothetical protein SAMN05421767_101100 [Granulicatella balaenopterae]|uniref:Uncharacterized protein n=1 Tax=Granulicatella balaenopterae TaxID=137733 RepID=A0A1H9H097_9LACT|nr:DUF6110 family protein [Granulicatella balaenopterae]SEQ55786.1 hypothetical protein SAMN05421767_101100 [Granulicatella balaenopterae]
MNKKSNNIAKLSPKTGAFLSGLALGSVGLKLIASKEAKHVYAKSLAKVYKAKDAFDSSMSQVKQGMDDIVDEAKNIYDEELLESNLEEVNEEVAE